MKRLVLVLNKKLWKRINKGRKLLSFLRKKEECQWLEGSKVAMVIDGDDDYEMDCQRGAVMGEDIGPNNLGVVRPNKSDELGVNGGLEINGLHDWVSGNKGNEANGINVEENYFDREMGIKGVQSKRWRNLEGCYPQSLVKMSAEKTQWVTGQTKQRQRHTKKAQQTIEEKSKWVGSLSLSDGCIEHRNKITKRDLSLFEVRRMISMGTRLGINFQDNKKVESRLLEVEGQIEVHGR
ncbi:hypothetical protein SLEP1_g9607 [Rubroshorea leprosula]|uniref:Uncharacterized protein n=1 Tax=Rubroshorea leprosula TaxID=152421 RepID=A0AAV5IFC7_9ROSI|nr:hypothetical protein SLEP1_g9607 [Rubroshorea leprosula]